MAWAPHTFFGPVIWCVAIVGALAADPPLLRETGDGANWPRFRGPGGAGVDTGADVPLTCDVKTGANIAWTAAVPAKGFSSPVVWGDRLLLSGGDKARCEVMCFDVRSGNLWWRSVVPKAVSGPVNANKLPDECDMAAATVATDGQRVYAIFASGDLAALDLDGHVVWSKSLGVPKNLYGHATSLLTWHDRVIVQFDQGTPADQLSKIYAFNCATGAVVWSQPRPVGASWATPIVIEVAGKSQIVALAAPWVISYSPQDGSEIWRANCLDGEVTPSPIFAAGTLYIVNPTIKLQAIRPDGRGDVTRTHLGWMAEDGIPELTSPVSDGNLVFVVTTAGVLTCYDAKDGRKQWEHDFDDECNASPSIVRGKLYLITKKGTLVVIEASRQFKELGRSELGEQVVASPAFAGGRMFVRGDKRLICITAKDVAPAKP